MRPAEVRQFLRQIRGWWYRRIPRFMPGSHRLRVIGFGRRWSCEKRGWTQEGLAHLVWEKLLAKRRGARILECSCGDGLVGCLGWWLEGNAGWSSDCQENRQYPLAQLRRNRAQAGIHPDLVFLQQTVQAGAFPYEVVLCHSSTAGSSLWRLMSKVASGPAVFAIWNRSGRDLWSRRMRKMGYRLALCRDRLELYQKR